MSRKEPAIEKIAQRVGLDRADVAALKVWANRIAADPEAFVAARAELRGSASGLFGSDRSVQVRAMARSQILNAMELEAEGHDTVWEAIAPSPEDPAP